MDNATTSQPVTPAEELREAARLMRERAEKATPGPWFVTSEAAQYGGLVATPTEAFPEIDGYAGHLIGESMSDGNRDYVAGMHPAVALAVAAWLDSVAERHVFIDAPTGGDDYFTACKACYFEPVEPDEESCPDVAAALAVARAYLGGTR